MFFFEPNRPCEASARGALSTGRSFQLTCGSEPWFGESGGRSGQEPLTESGFSHDGAIDPHTRGGMTLGNLLEERGFGSLSQLLEAYRGRLAYHARKRRLFLSFHAEDKMLDFQPSTGSTHFRPSSRAREALRLPYRTHLPIFPLYGSEHAAPLRDGS